MGLAPPKMDARGEGAAVLGVEVRGVEVDEGEERAASWSFLRSVGAAGRAVGLVCILERRAGRWRVD